MQCEFQGTGLSWEFAKMEVQGFSFMEGLALLGFDVVFMAFLGYYLDQILPKQYGVPKPANFLCKRLYGVCKSGFSSGAGRQKVRVGDEIQDQERVSRGNFEDVSSQVQRDQYSLKVRNLRKVYGNGKVAVENVSMTMYSGQIFALLGHNGAGKTTTISTLTGLLTPTKGQAELNGYDVLEH